MGHHILVVEDEPDISALLAYHLTRASHRVRTVAGGLEALSAIQSHRPALVILDLMLPELPGLEFLSRLRADPELHDLPVLILTARGEERERVEGLRAGADDYVTKPFSPEELVLRVEAILRRVPSEGDPPSGTGRKLLRDGAVLMDLGAAQVEVAGTPVQLTPTEFRLLRVLMERRGRVQSRVQLLDSVWDEAEEVTPRTVDMHIQRLRGKLGMAAKGIETVRGFGYRWRSDFEG